MLAEVIGEVRERLNGLIGQRLKWFLFVFEDKGVPEQLIYLFVTGQF